MVPISVQNCGLQDNDSPHRQNTWLPMGYKQQSKSEGQAEKNQFLEF